MASLLGKLWSKFRTKKAPLSIMIVGLDNSGKTSILNRLATLNADGSYHQRSSPTPSSKESSMSHATHMTTEGNITSSGFIISDNNNNIMPTIGYNYERVQYKNITLTVLDFSGQNRYRNLWQEFYNGVDAIVFVVDSSDLIRLVVARDELEIMLSHPYFTSLTLNEVNDEQQLNHLQTLTSPSATNALTVQKQITISQGKLVQSPLYSSSSSSSSSSSTLISNKQHQTGSIHQQNKVNFTHRRRTKVPILFLANKADLASSVDSEVIVKALNLNQLPVDRHPWFIQPTSVNMNQGIAKAFDWLVNQLMASSTTV